MTIVKWIFTILFLLFSVFTFGLSTDGKGPAGIEYLIGSLIYGLTILFGIFVSRFWYKDFTKRKNSYSLILCLLPFFVLVINFSLYLFTQQKINKDYFLHAINPAESSHNFQYYFRIDSTLKTHGNFFGFEANDYQEFRMQGDTIFLDTILDATGIQSKIYLKAIEIDSSGEKVKFLIPLDNNRKRNDSLVKFIVQEEKK